MFRPDTFADLTSIVQAAANVAVLLLGAGWTAYLFKNRRGKFPRANITHEIIDRRIEADKILLRVDVSIANVGDVLLQIEHGIVRVNQMLPVTENLLEDINADGGIDDFNVVETKWPNLAAREQDWLIEMFEIEPAETDEVNYDFVIPFGVKTVEVYTYFRNAKKRPREIGWGHTSIHEISD